MSINGVTFDLRKARARDDARIYQKMLNDGILAGCAMTYSGADLTIGVGSMIACGRELCFDAAETVTSVTTEANGYGRLRLVLDLSETPSASGFPQAAWEWDYQAANSDWPALTQNDINDGASTDYEMVVAIVSFASSAISGVVYTMPTLSAKYDVPLRVVNLSIATTAFVADTTYTDYPYRAAVAVTGALSTMLPEVVFGLTDAISGILAPVVESYDGGVYIYASEVPAAAVTIATLTLWKAV